MCSQLSWNKLIVRKISFEGVPFGAGQVAPAALRIGVGLCPRVQLQSCLLSALGLHRDSGQGDCPCHPAQVHQTTPEPRPQAVSLSSQQQQGKPAAQCCFAPLLSWRQGCTSPAFPGHPHTELHPRTEQRHQPRRRTQRGGQKTEHLPGAGGARARAPGRAEQAGVCPDRAPRGWAGDARGGAEEDAARPRPARPRPAPLALRGGGQSPALRAGGSGEHGAGSTERPAWTAPPGSAPWPRARPPPRRACLQRSWVRGAGGTGDAGTSCRPSHRPAPGAERAPPATRLSGRDPALGTRGSSGSPMGVGTAGCPRLPAAPSSSRSGVPLAMSPSLRARLLRIWPACTARNRTLLLRWISRPQALMQ